MQKHQIFFILFALFLVLVCITLGFWQLDRLSEKQAYLIKLSQRSAQAETVSLHDALQDLDASYYRRIKLRGRWRESESVFFRAAVLKGQSGLGYVTPFDVLSRDGEYHRVFIYRGWVPLVWQQKVFETNREMKIEKSELHEITVMIKPYPKDHWSLPANQPEKRFYVTLDATVRPNLLAPPSSFVAVAPFMGHALPALQPVQKPYGALSYPLAQKPSLEIANDHLQYAITWFALAAAILLLTGFKSGLMPFKHNRHKMI